MGDVSIAHYSLHITHYLKGERMSETIFTQTAKVYEACYPTQKEAARALGIDRCSLWRYKKGKRIPRPDIMKMVVDNMKIAEKEKKYGYSTSEIEFENGFIFRRTTRASKLSELADEALDSISDIEAVETKSGTIDNPVKKVTQKIIVRKAK